MAKHYYEYFSFCFLPLKMTHLSPRIIFLMSLSPLLWASNAVLGRMSVGILSPITLNMFRWVFAALVLLPLGWRILKGNSPLWQQKKRFFLLGLFAVGCYNTFQYLSLQTSTPINVTLIAASMPIWMMLIGAIFYDTQPQLRQLFGAFISILGVVVVLSRGELSSLLKIHLVVGDLFILFATIIWAFYSWMLTKPGTSTERSWHWAEFLLAQVVFGLISSIVFSGMEAMTGTFQFEFNAWVLALLLYIAIGPSIIAYRCWGLGVQEAGPAVASFFSNLTPVFAAIMSAVLLGEMPQLFHAAAFFLILIGILVSSKIKWR
jgi:drug/metabolite transporter (DMT)-like permease